jgi:sedoheptulokinase
MKLAGIDLGTTTICGLLLDADSGEIVSVRTEPTTAVLRGASPWEALQDPETILGIAESIVGGFLDRHGDIRAIGVAGQMHGILYVDSAGRAVSPLFTWQDGRGDQKRPDGTTYAEWISRSAGMPLSTGMGFVTHVVNAQSGSVPAAAASVCTIADYVAMRLCGARTPVMDATNAASLGCFDLDRLDFRRDAMEKLGVDPSLFPVVAADYPALGETRGRVPVHVGMGDNQASYLGSVAELSGSLLVNIGTGSQLSAFAAQRMDIPGIDTRPFPLGGYIGVGAALCGGRAYALLHEFFDRTVRLFTGATASASWDVMNAVDESSLSTLERLIVDTRFNGTRRDPGVRGSITNLSPPTFNPESLIVGVREGIADELLGFLDLFPARARGGLRLMAGSGNGIRLNRGLQSVFETRLGMRMNVPRHREETSFGAALLAGVASGAIPDLGAAGRFVRYL